jgi:hypothetical protein
MTTENRPAPICFLDTETFGLDPESPVWEFAAIRREWPLAIEQWGGDIIATPQGQDKKFHCFIDHYDPEPWLAQMRDTGGAVFVKDYQARFSPISALTTHQAAQMIHTATRGAHIIGACPSFDTERLAKLLRRCGMEPEWHYHLCDVENMIVGYLSGQGQPMPPPWKSDTLSRAVGVEPEDFSRHTAMGDVLWVKAQYDAVMKKK